MSDNRDERSVSGDNTPQAEQNTEQPPASDLTGSLFLENEHPFGLAEGKKPPALGIVHLTEGFRLDNGARSLLMELAESVARRPPPPKSHSDFINKFWRTVEKHLPSASLITLLGVLKNCEPDPRLRFFMALPSQEAVNELTELLQAAPEGFDWEQFLGSLPTTINTLLTAHCNVEDWRRFARQTDGAALTDRLSEIKLD